MIDITINIINKINDIWSVRVGLSIYDDMICMVRSHLDYQIMVNSSEVCLPDTWDWSILAFQNLFNRQLWCIIAAIHSIVIEIHHQLLWMLPTIHSPILGTHHKLRWTLHVTTNYSIVLWTHQPVRWIQAAIHSIIL